MTPLEVKKLDDALIRTERSCWIQSNVKKEKCYWKENNVLGREEDLRFINNEEVLLIF